MKENWIEKYWKHMVDENFDEAIPLKFSNFPQSFFKYRSLNTLTLQSLEQNYIWLAEISSLNDPFECSIQFDNDECLREFYGSDKFQKDFELLTGQTISKNEIKQLIRSEKPYEKYLNLCIKKGISCKLSPKQQVDKFQRRWNEIVDNTNKNIRVCSFSLINTSLLLWSHYSADHKGICIEYDFWDVDHVRTFMQPVVYSNKVHKIKLFEDYTTMQMVGSSLIKSKDWEYEKEWRLTIFKQGENFPQKMSVPDPIAIYLGTRFHLNDEDSKDALYSIANERQIPMYQMKKDAQEFKLIAQRTT